MTDTDTYYIGPNENANLGETLDYSHNGQLDFANVGDYGGHNDTGQVAEFPDAIEAYPGIYYDRRDRKPRHVNATLKRIPVLAATQNGQPVQVCSPNPNRTKIRFFTDGSNGSAIYVQRSSGASDLSGSIALAVSSIPFEMNCTHALYAWATANGYLYVVEESE